MKKLKLTSLSNQNLESREMYLLNGEGTIENAYKCSCYYEGNGGSTSATNASQNDAIGIQSPVGCNQFMVVGGHIGTCESGDESHT